MLQSATADTKKATARGNSQPPPAPNGLLTPQVAVLGNQATLRRMRKCDCGGAPDCDCDMGNDHKKKETDSPRTALHRKPSGSAPGLLDTASQSFFEARLQRKEQQSAPPPSSGLSIQIGAIDDPLERDADQIADRVLRMPDPKLRDPRESFSSTAKLLPKYSRDDSAGSSLGAKLAEQNRQHGPSTRPDAPALRRKCACGGSCDTCKEEEKGKLQRKSAETIEGMMTSTEAPAAVHQVLRMPGQPLDGETRSFMEPRFGRDFSQVRVHTDAAAAQSARAVNALAYTVGSHISFAEGSFAPSSAGGKRLLAHELAHTVQQGEATSSQRTAPIRRSLLQREPSKYAKLTIQELRKLVTSGDKEAVQALFQRYEAMSNVELARYASGSDQIAQSVYAKRVVPPADAVGQGRFSKDGIQDTLTQDIKADRGTTRINRRAPSAVEPNLEVQGGTVGAARTDIPGLEGRSFVGRSPQAGGQVNPNSNFPPATDFDTLPQTHGHAEQNIADQLEEALAKIPREQLKGRKVWMLIEQAPCSTCAQGAVNAETAAGVLKKLSLKYPEVTFEVKSLESNSLIVLKGAESASAGAAGAAPNESGGPAGEEATSIQVQTKIEVINSTRNADGTTVSEVEYNFGQSLDKINSTAPPGTTVPSRIVMKVTQNADGSLASVESLSGQPQAMVEALAQKTLTGAASEAAGVGEGAAVAAANTGRGAALLFKGLKIGGTAAFVVITAYQLFTATPKERPRVLASAAGGLAGGAVSTYLICNALLDIETAGWGLLICGAFAGGAGAYAGSKTSEAAYDAATATDLDKAYNTLSKKGKNEIGIFNFLIGRMGSDGCVDAPFVQAFLAIFPALANDSETLLIAAQLADAAIQAVPPVKTLRARSFPEPFSSGRDTVCPGCHGRSTKDLVPQTMTPSDLDALKNLPTCSTVTSQALNALRFAVQNLPPRPRSEMMHEPFQPAKRTLGPNEHSAPPNVTLPDPIPRTFPTEQEQLGTKCPTCHDVNEGKNVWKDFRGGFGSGPDGKMTDADYKRLGDWVPAQQK